MEKVRRILKKNLSIFFYRILRDEYTRTNFKNVGKAQFPSLLKRLWTNDPIGTKTNVIKSFMKAGIFPFNPNSIDRSRILKNNTDIEKTTLKVPISSVNNDQASTIQNPSDSQAMMNSFATSHQAIASLDRILKDTTSNNDTIEDFNGCANDDHDDDDDDEDEDQDDDQDDEYIPPKPNVNSSKSTSSNKQNKVQSHKITTTKDHPSVLLPEKKKRKSKFSTIIGFDTSEEGKILNFITFLML